MFLELFRDKKSKKSKAGYKLGLFELESVAFKKKTKKYLSSCDINLEEAFPNMFSKSGTISKKVRKIIVTELDTVMDVNKGFYYIDKNFVTHMSFKKLPKSASKIKINGAVDNIRKKLSEVAPKPETNVKDNNGDGPKKVGDGDNTLSEIIKQGLVANPTPKQMSVWLARVVQNMLHDKSRIISKDLLDLVNSEDIYYRPVLNVQKNMIVGNYSLIAVKEKSKTPAEAIRKEVIQFIHACLEMARLGQNKQFVQMIVPLSLATLLEKEAVLLIRIVLGRMCTLTRMGLVFEFKIPSDKILTQDNKDDLKFFSDNAMGVAIKYELYFPSRHDLGEVDILFYSTDASGGAHQKLTPDRIKNFVEFYKDKNPTFHFGNVKDQTQMDMLLSFNPEIVSGNFVGQPAKKASPEKNL